MVACTETRSLARAGIVLAPRRFVKKEKKVSSEQ
jgi:hypothetical protein